MTILLSDGFTGGTTGASILGHIPDTVQYGSNVWSNPFSAPQFTFAAGGGANSAAVATTQSVYSLPGAPSDFIFTVSFVPNASGCVPTVYCRCDSSANFNAFDFNQAAGALYVGQLVAGVFTGSIATYGGLTFTTGVTYTAIITLSGTTLNVTLNGTPLGAKTLPVNLNQSIQGIAIDNQLGSGAADVKFISVEIDATGPATATFSGPSTGSSGSPSTNFTITLDTAAIGVGQAVTLSDGGGGGTFAGTHVSGSVLTIPNGTSSDTFTYTPGSVGTKVITPTSSGIVFTPTTLNYISTSTTATAFSLSGPSTGLVGSASSNFSFTPNGNYTGTLTPTMAALSGTWIPSTLTWTGDASTKTATFTPSIAGSGNANANSSPSLTPPSNVAFAASAGTAYYSFIYGTGGVTPTFVIKDMSAGTVTPISGGTPVNQGTGAWTASFVSPTADYVGIWNVSGTRVSDPGRIALSAGTYFSTISGLGATVPTFTIHNQSGSVVSFTSGGTVVDQGNGVFTCEFGAPAGSYVGVWSAAGNITLSEFYSTVASGGSGPIPPTTPPFLTINF